MNKIVVDANVIIKTIIKETGSNAAFEFLRACVSKKIEIIAPNLIQYEIAQIAVKKGVSIDKAIDKFEERVSSLIKLKSPDRFTWLQAEKICRSGHEKSGFPSIYDSIYHAIAIIEDGVFITADKRHHAKSKDFGHIVLLEDWKETLSTL